jgi:hypothetical protein
MPTHVCVQPYKKLGFLEKLFSAEEYCKICGHLHREHLQPWAIEWAASNLDWMAYQRLAALIAIDFITGADF